MKIMLIEDDSAKHSAIESFLLHQGVKQHEIVHVRDMTDFAANPKESIDLFIIDFFLPSFDGGDITPNGIQILQTIERAGKPHSSLIAISSHPDEFPDLREAYEAKGCILADYSNEQGWQASLKHILIQLKRNITFDFLIFCALNEERAPYATLCDVNPVNRAGINCLDIDIDGKSGTVILLPQMGIVNAAAVAGQCINQFRPNFVGMSGICGGFSNRAKLGQLFVSSMAYEYQSGKWASDEFKQEPYQVNIEHQTLAKLQMYVEKDSLILELEEGFTGIRPSEKSKPELGIFTSGSAVIANSTLIKQIEKIHRKVNALDMEVFSIKRAAELAINKPITVCAKTVVDLCDNNKDDDLHVYGSYISAKFLLMTIRHFLANED